MSPKTKILARMNDSIAEAERFLRFAKVARCSIDISEHYHGDRNLAQAKRASLDLSRSLAELRKPLWEAAR